MLWHRLVLTALGCVGVMLMAGCAVDTQGLTPPQQNAALDYYWPEGKNVLLLEDDNAAVTIGKVTGRTLVGVLLLGLSEAGNYDRGTEAFTKYAKGLRNKKYYDSFVKKSKADVIQEFGAPTRTSSDGKTGEILVYDGAASGATAFQTSFNSVSSQAFSMWSQSASMQFYIDKEGTCYGWRLKGASLMPAPAYREPPEEGPPVL